MSSVKKNADGNTLMLYSGYSAVTEQVEHKTSLSYSCLGSVKKNADGNTPRLYSISNVVEEKGQNARLRCRSRG